MAGCMAVRILVDQVFITMTAGTGWSMILVIALAVLILAAALCYAAVFCWVRARRINRERSVVHVKIEELLPEIKHLNQYPASCCRCREYFAEVIIKSLLQL